MTVQELIDELNKIEDKTLEVRQYDYSDIDEVYIQSVMESVEYSFEKDMDIVRIF